MIDEKFLQILVCPETHQPLAVADDALVARLNGEIGEGKISNRSGEKVEEVLTGGLVREDGEYLYPLFDDIPCLLVEESIRIA